MAALRLIAQQHSGGKLIFFSNFISSFALIFGLQLYTTSHKFENSRCFLILSTVFTQQTQTEYIGIVD